jgi:hypothetical protein
VQVYFLIRLLNAKNARLDLISLGTPGQADGVDSVAASQASAAVHSQPPTPQKMSKHRPKFSVSFVPGAVQKWQIPCF